MRSIVSTLACMVIACLSGCGSSSQPIRIGLAGPFNESHGASMRRGAQLAIAEINQKGGVGGRPLELVARDDRAEAVVAVGVARELYETDGLVAVIGHMTSDATLAAAPVYNGGPSPVVVISPSASSRRMSRAGPYTFRICPDELQHAQRLAEWARNRLGARTAAVLYRNDADGRGVSSAFRNSFTALGGAVLAADPYLPRTLRVEPYLRRLQALGGVDVLIIGGTANDAEQILPTLSSLNFTPTVLGSDRLSGLEASGVGVDASGVFVSSAYLPDQRNPRNRAFVEAYRRAYDDQLPDHRGAGAYDIVYLLRDARDAVGTNRSRLRAYLARVGPRTPFEGVTGTIAFDENGDVTDKPVLIGVVRNHQLVTAPGQ